MTYSVHRQEQAWNWAWQGPAPHPLFFLKNMRSPSVSRSRSMVLIGILMASMAAHAGCRLQALVPHGSEARVGALPLKLGDADDAIAPQAWQGPLVAGKCTLDIGIIERPLMLAPGNLLYVPDVLR